jgi:hypothetical protein
MPVQVTVIGGGEHADDLARDIAQLKHVAVRIMGEMSVKTLEDVLKYDVDVLLGMGTSILEGARLGIPSILLDVSYGPVPDGYMFTWLQDRDGFTLGEIASSRPSIPGNDSLTRRLREATTEYEALSLAIYGYYCENHAPASVTAEFVRQSDLSTCFYEEFKKAGFSARDPIYERFAMLRKRLSSQ